MTTFPRMETTALDGTGHVLPADLPAARTLVLLAFRQGQQGRVDEWIARAAADGFAADLSRAGDGQPDSAVIEVPCIGRQWSLARRFIDGGMAAAIRQPEVLARTWTCYTDVGRVQRALGIPDSDSVWAFVVRAGGDVVASSAGEPADEAAWGPIRDALVQP